MKKRMNNKGFTLIELIVSFTLMAALMTGLFSITFGLRDLKDKSLLFYEMKNYQIALTSRISQVLEYGGRHITAWNYCPPGAQGTDYNCIRIGTSQGDVTIRALAASVSIVYIKDSVSQTEDYPLPTSAYFHNAYTDAEGNVIEDLSRKINLDNVITDATTGNGYYLLQIPISNKELINEFMIEYIRPRTVAME